ncbi:MAG: trehalose-6-phosphate synthase, partial [Frankiales bacterium]|nr:trehalose-6-phosphate synthase [Frankiales bacterium]
MPAPLLLASNRGPLSWVEDARGEPTPVRGAGGLVSAVTSAAGDAVWVCAALSDTDRRVARSRQGAVSPGVVMLDLDPVTFDRAYNGVANALLWFVAHLLFDTATAPV